MGPRQQQRTLSGALEAESQAVVVQAADLGLTVRDVTEALQTAIAGSRAGDYHADGNAYRILVQLADPRHLSIDEVLDRTLRTPGGELVALRNVVESQASPRQRLCRSRT
jgi:multidrug efflux pump subunit AcrB